MKTSRSAAEVAEIEAPKHQRKQEGLKSKKTQAQKDKHKDYCRKHREKKTRTFEELKQMKTEYNEMVPKFEQMQAKNQEMKLELEKYKFIIGFMKNYIQEHTRTLQIQGQNLSFIDQWIECFVSPLNVQDGQVSATSGSVLPGANEFLELGATGTHNFPPSMSYLNPQMDFGNYIGPECFNLTAPVAGLSSVTNHDLSFMFDASDSQGVGINFAAGSSSGANHDHLSVFDAPNNHDNPVNNHLAAGVVTNSAAGSSFGANPELPIVVNATNNHENDGDLFTHAPGPAAGFQPSGIPSSGAVWRVFP